MKLKMVFVKDVMMQLIKLQKTVEINGSLSNSVGE